MDSESNSAIKASFAHTVNIAVFISGTFDLFDVLCKQHNRTGFNPFFKWYKKTVMLTVRVNRPQDVFVSPKSIEQT